MIARRRRCSGSSGFARLLEGAGDAAAAQVTTRWAGASEVCGTVGGVLWCAGRRRRRRKSELRRCSSEKNWGFLTLRRDTASVIRNRGILL